MWGDLLKHDKPLSEKAPAPHLRDVPAYLLDPTTQEASKIVKLASAVTRKINNSSRRKGSQGKSRNRDPLKSFFAQGQKNSSKGGMKRKGNDGDSGKKNRRKHT